MEGINIKKPEYENVKMQVVIVGAGANGSHFFRSFLQDVTTHYGGTLDKKWHVDITLCDKDEVERKNLSNQVFAEEDIGDPKVIALSDRYGSHYGVEVKTLPDYITNQDTLHRLFTPLQAPETVQVIPILISMVDNTATRKIFDEFFFSDYLPDLIYIDAGVEGVSVDKTLSKEEKDSTGFSGQVCTGVKMDGKVWLEPVMRVYPDMWEDKDYLPEQSCGEAIVNNPQRSATNKMAATLSNGVMNNLMHNNMIYVHHVDFNAQFGGSRPTFIKSSLIKEYNSQ